MVEFSNAVLNVHKTESDSILRVCAGAESSHTLL